MTESFRAFAGSLWSRPDPALAEAGVAGELLVAKVQLSLATLLLAIPVIKSLFFLLNQPHTAVNSKVIFEGYFLAIASTSLRYDKRIRITAGVLAFGEYLALACYASSHWDLNSPAYAPYPYGLFSWSPKFRG